MLGVGCMRLSLMSMLAISLLGGTLGTDNILGQKNSFKTNSRWCQQFKCQNISNLPFSAKKQQKVTINVMDFI